MEARLKPGGHHHRNPTTTSAPGAVLVFFWHGTAETLLDAVYWAPPSPAGPNASIADPARGALFGPRGWVHEEALGWLQPAPRQLVYVLLKLLCFLVGTWACWRRGYFWKI